MGARAWFAFHILGVRPDDLRRGPRSTSRWTGTSPWTSRTIKSRRSTRHRSGMVGSTARRIVTGHTGRTRDVLPDVGAPPSSRSPRRTAGHADMARPGNRILVTKTAGLEATAILANTFPDLTERTSDGVTSRRARPVRVDEHGDDALAARRSVSQGWSLAARPPRRVRPQRRVGDSTGLRPGVEVDLTKVHVDPAVAAVSKVFGMDPLDAISEGTLDRGQPDATADVLASLRKRVFTEWTSASSREKASPCHDRDAIPTRRPRSLLGRIQPS